MSLNHIGQEPGRENSNLIMHPLALVRRGMDMSGADMSNGDYRKIDFFQSNLQMVKGIQADFRGAILAECDLRGVDFSGANLRGADLCRSVAVEANFSQCDLRGARIWGVDLRGADCTGADLRNADLRDVMLDGARIDGMRLSPYKIVPESGAFVGWRVWGDYLLRFLIPADAKRTNSIGSRICRADQAQILGCWDRERREVAMGSQITVDDLKICVHRDFKLVGHQYNDNITSSQPNGIWFYLSYEEAAAAR